MKPSTILITVILLPAIFLGIFTFYTDLAQRYGVSYDSTKYGGLYNATNDVMSISENITKNIQGVTSPNQSFGTISIIFDFGFLFLNAFKLMVAGLINILKMLTDSFIGILPAGYAPAWLMPTIWSVIVLFVAFKILSIILKRDV